MPSSASQCAVSGTVGLLIGHRNTSSSNSKQQQATCKAGHVTRRKIWDSPRARRPVLKTSWVGPSSPFTLLLKNESGPNRNLSRIGFRGPVWTANRDGLNAPVITRPPTRSHFLKGVISAPIVLPRIKGKGLQSAPSAVDAK